MGQESHRDPRRLWRALRRAVVLGAGVASAIVDVAHAAPQIPMRAEEVVLVSRHPEARGRGRIAIVPESGAWNRLFRAGSARVADFPLPDGKRIELEIASFDLLGKGTRFFVETAGSRREVSAPDMRFFRGQVTGDPDSLVSLTLFQGRIAGFVRFDGREYTFGPRSYSPDREGAHDVEVVDESSDPPPANRCDGGEEWGERATKSLGDSPALHSASAASIDANTLLRAKIAVEGTVEWVNKHGGVAAATTYTMNLMAQVSAIYENDAKIQLEVPYVLMNAAEPDGYSGASNSTSTVLGEMRTKWNGTPSLQNVFRTAAHLFSTYPSGGAGRAYVDVLCDNVPVNVSSTDYGVSLLDGNGGSWERRLVAHELGHNFSSPHSQCFSPELDKCATETGCYSGTIVQTTGTIMSYCDVRLSTFHPRERDEKIRPGAQAAYPTCMEVAGMPGDLGGLSVDEAGACNAENLQADDGAGNGSFGFSGAARAAWVKRFRPSCYPFKLTGVDVKISQTASVAAGRAVRIVVYTDRTGSGTPAMATLAHSEDTTVQVVGSGSWNQYTLASPVILEAGDFYIGFHDLVADAPSTYILDYDTSRPGESWWQADSTDPAGYAPFTIASGSWMIRGHGGGVNPGSVVLAWGAPCNDVEVPDQDFAVYQGTFGAWFDPTLVTCTTGRSSSWLLENPPSGSFWLVVPQNSANEGSYGRSTAGERPPAVSACKPQSVGVCP